MPPKFQLHEAFKSDDDKPESHKEKGNDAFKQGKWDEALKHYDKAISLDPEQASFYSNRAACWAQKKEFEKVLEDAEKCAQLDPKFAKAYTRKGQALFSLKRLDEAEKAFEECLKIDPINEVAKKSIADCKEVLQARKKAERAQKFGGIGKFMNKFGDRFKGGSWGGHIKSSLLKYSLMIGAFAAYKFVGPLVAGLGSETDSASPEPGDSSTVVPLLLHRRFRQMDQSWQSYVEAGTSSNLRLLMLHRTSLSAEAEFGDLIPQLTKAAPAGLQVVAPDRPCHGYSLCPEGGEPQDGASFFGRFLSQKGKATAKEFAYMASGRETARHVLEIVQRRRAAARVLLLRPQMVVPDSKGVMSPMAAADSARWALLMPNSIKEGAAEGLDVENMPKGSAVTLVYFHGDEEDSVLKKTLEDGDVMVDVRQVESMQDVLPAMTDLLASGSATHVKPKGGEAHAEAEEAEAEAEGSHDWQSEL